MNINEGSRRSYWDGLQSGSRWLARRASLLAVCAPFLGGCSGDASEATSDVALPTWEEFEASLPRTPEGRYIVERDIAVHPSRLPEIYQQFLAARTRPAQDPSIQTSEQALT